VTDEQGSQSDTNPIRAFLKLHGFRQNWLVKNTGASAAMVSNWMRDKNAPSAEYEDLVLKATGGAITRDQIAKWRRSLNPRGARRWGKAVRLAS